MSVGVALDVLVEPFLAKRPVLGVQEHGCLFLGGGTGSRRGVVLSGARGVHGWAVSKVEEPLVDGDLGAKVFEGVAGEVDDGEPLLLIEDLDALESEEGPSVDGTFELYDLELLEGVEELDELANVEDHGRTELLVCADLRAVELHLLV